MNSEQERRYRNNHLPSSIAARKRYKERHRAKILAQAREYNMRPDVAKKRAEFYRLDRLLHPEKYRRVAAKYFQSCKAEIYKRRNRRTATVPQARLSKAIRTYIGNVLKKRVGSKGESFWGLVGCTPDELKSHLESQFAQGMSWDNWTKGGWHIDHIRPLASFNLTIKEQRLRAFHFTNLKPEWADINHSKNSLYSGKRWTYKDHLQASTSCTIPAPAVNCA